MTEEKVSISDLSATEFLSTLAFRLEAEADDKGVAKILAESLLGNAAPVDDVIAVLNALASVRSNDLCTNHE